MRERVHLTEVLDAVHVLIGLVGWSTVGLALSSLYPFTLVVIVGLVGATMTARAPRLGIVLECITMALSIGLVGESAIAALALGIGIVALGMSFGVWGARRRAAGM
jgi:hypothetical protein